MYQVKFYDCRQLVPDYHLQNNEYDILIGTQHTTQRSSITDNVRCFKKLRLTRVRELGSGNWKLALKGLNGDMAEIALSVLYNLPFWKFLLIHVSLFVQAVLFVINGQYFWQNYRLIQKCGAFTWS